MGKFSKWCNAVGLDNKPWQESAFKWCCRREKAGSGGIFADEMGLGKTIVMLGVLAFRPGSTLIVLPRHLIDQWAEASEKFIGQEPFIYHGTVAPEALEENESKVVITTYGTMISRNRYLRNKTWDRIICDEAHHMRNAGLNWLMMRQIPRRIHWLVTGTPIQNTPNDLVALERIAGCRHLLRRTREEVGIQMPALRTTTMEVEWQDEEEAQIASEIHDLALGGRGGIGLNIADDISGWTMVRFLRAKQVCIFPELVAKTISTYGLASSKLDAVTQKILSRADNGRRKLVFCFFRMEIDELERRLQNAGMHVGVLDGRGKNQDGDVLLIQIQAGCEGLNLQEFSEVYFTSPHWNPAMEDQAIARCYRIGQKEDVDVFRFSMIDDVGVTMDEYIHDVQERKREDML